MKPAVDAPAKPLVDSLLEWVRRTTGIAPHGAIRSGVERALRRTAAAGQCVEALTARALDGEPAARRLILEGARVGETYFFRHGEQLEEVPGALPPRGGAVWCAGCSTGEEAYSVAILAAEAGRPARIVATDVSEPAVAATRAATYGAWALRKLSARRLAQHFAPVSKASWTVAAPLREAVSAQVHNLLDPPVDPGPFDVILCRNVLIYFGRDTAAQVLQRLAGTLRPGGVLMVAPSELGLAPRALFVPARLGRALVLRRSEEVTSAPARRAAPPPPPPPPADLRVHGRPPVARVRAHPAPTRPGDVARIAVPPARPPVQPACPPVPSARPPVPPADTPGPAATAAVPEAPTPEHFVRAAHAADARGDLDAAFEHLRSALFLGPELPFVHALIASVHRRAGRADDAARERNNALALLHLLADDAPLEAADGLTAGALRSALLTSPHESLTLERHAHR